jgi:hypothetical protein
MFQANAVQINAFQIGAQAAAVVVEDERSRGGFDPYFYKRRNKRRSKAEDVQEFVSEVLSAEAPEAAEQAKIAALQYLAIQNTALEADKREALSTALREINDFYRHVRDEIKRRQDLEDEEDDDLLLLGF